MLTTILVVCPKVFGRSLPSLAGAPDLQKGFPGRLTLESLPSISALVSGISGRAVPHLSAWLLEQVPRPHP